MKTVIVTGAANGIGLAISKAYVNEGAFVYMVDKNREKLTEEAGKLENTEAVSADVSSYEEVKKLFHHINEKSGTVDILINNAGISKFKSIWDVSVEDWEEIIHTNLSSVFYCSREAALLMDQGGSIVNLCSTRAHMSEPDTEGYAASKGGIFALTHSLAVTLSEKDITVNAISPGWIHTGDYESLRTVDHEQHLSNRVGKPEDVARACLFLTDEANNFINGENLVIDGGMTRKMIYEH
ncbi:SDR family NAD(P)-dependent oxidoreductase [Jeotgalibacillus terrae]|uniref:SDR family NAD(P)-dependent oxidoreductase n=1 Tax=Jeotgalibacillus terrae TaxID=587735 RepID=A0ABW5ZG10_9BACL|nr:SDR family oxidoreductase [Jeotgalibacillus terrae]MBM7578302.1 NAD(P)-dependent dehydrogenase (short-subunit alcohol dehydrogenase family) [Jeotgalibacillus terrae]